MTTSDDSHAKADSATTESRRTAATQSPGTLDDELAQLEDGTVPDKQIWRWKDDGGAIGGSSG